MSVLSSVTALALFLAAHLAALAVLAATAWAAGSWITRALSREGWAERLAVPVAIGLAALAHLGFLLASLGLLRPGVLVAAMTMILATAVAARRASFEAGRAVFPHLPRGSGWKIACGLAALAPLFVLALYPPTAFDETMYHLPYARAFARSGGLPALPALRFPVFPALAELLFAQVLSLAGDVATHLVSLLAVLATAGLLVAWGRRAFSPAAGWIAAALYLGNPIVVSLAGTDYVEPLLALFVTGALFAAWNFQQSGERAWLLAAAAFAGSAAGVKYLGLFFAAAVFVDLAAAGRRKPAAPMLFALTAFLVLAPTYIRILAQTGNPIFPYLPGLFGSTPWDPIALKPLRDVLAPETLVRLARLPWDVVFHRSAVGQQPPFSPFYLLGLPLLLAGALRDSRVRRLLAIPAAWGAAFLFLPPDARYLVAILPPVSLALAGRIRIEKRSWQAAVCALAFLPGWLYAGYRIAKQGPPPATAAERDVYLAGKLPLYRAVRHLDRISAVAYAFDAESMKYFYDGPLYGDWIGPASFRRFRPLLATPAALHREISQLGASHLLVSRRTVRPPQAAVGQRDWNRWFRKVYEDPAAEVFALQLDRSARALNRGEESRLLAGCNFEAQPEAFQDRSHSVCLGMLGSQPFEVEARGERARRVLLRIAPGDEERHQAAFGLRREERPPCEQRPVRPPARAFDDARVTEPGGFERRDDRREIVRRGTPGRDARRGHLTEPGEGRREAGAFRVGCDDLEVPPRPEAGERVVRAEARMPPPRNGSDAEPLGDPGDAGGEVGRADQEVVELQGSPQPPPQSVGGASSTLLPAGSRK